MSNVKMYRFSEIPEGRHFEYEGNMFLKTKQDGDSNALNLHTNKTAGFIDNARVYSVTEAV